MLILQPISCILILKFNQMKDVIIKEHIFNHSIDQVWKAISIGEEISNWFIPADFKAEKGYHYTFKSKGEDCSVITGEVKEASPYTLIYSWIVKDAPAETIVKWVLTPTSENTTKLYLEHSGISNYSGETAVAMFTSFDGGWNNCITKLTEYLMVNIHAG